MGFLIFYVDNGVGMIVFDGCLVFLMGIVSGIGVNMVDNIQFGEMDDESMGFFFILYVQLIGDFCIVFYCYELVNFEIEFQIGGVFFNVFVGMLVMLMQCLIVDVFILCFFLVQVLVEVDIENIGVLFVYKFSEMFFFGFGVSFYEFEVNG